MILDILLSNLAFFMSLALLFLPPTIVFILPRAKIDLSVYRILIFGFAPAGTFLLMIMLSKAYWVFPMYLMVFYFILIFTRKRLQLDRVVALGLALYVPFAISVLWEIPIQLAIAQNPIALAMSGFKALAIPFFMLSVYKLGYRPKLRDFIILGFIVVMGVGLYQNLAFQMQYYPRDFMDRVLFDPLLIVLSHVYRIPWFLLFLSMLQTLYRKRVI